MPIEIDQVMFGMPPQENSGSGWRSYVQKDNEWTMWAERNGLNLDEQNVTAVSHKRHKGITLGKPPRIPRRIFMESPWTRWFDKRVKESVRFTVAEYKSLFNGKLPDYATSFKSRGVSLGTINSDRYKKSFNIPQEVRAGKVRRIERERCLNFHQKYERVYVERTYDALGKVIDVSLLHFFGTNYAMVTHNHKVTGHKWDCTRRGVLVEPFPPVPYIRYLNLETPWAFKD